GLSIVASISGENVVRGLIGAAVGIVIATVGMDPVLGSPRFSFGNANLMSGVSFIPALIGLFAISQVLIDAEEQNDTLAKNEIHYRKQKVPLKEIFSKWIEFLRSSVIGTVIGIIPGSGAGISTFLAYNESKRFSKTPEKYGKGHEDGVIATETSNNATTGGALVPLLTLGIPGDAVTAVIFGGLLIHGLS